ncbi:hypothetical protein ARHIZOSPH14_31300 [Agromyces rhizosphaerae]|uniref:Winged helix DNA-binding domain-containing protein n=1 Tax=Agromyces rhizosphaerae TaxID=88374 RepID=A0A9W6CUV2_9MICO|nr:winged helix DNA-binding domain-containing protein [Agromyces rhizosphaerae]GLI28888.1 hypothetical protein ARHIZOSPH14_31300 [Agromyces rhizosphaerae]
MAAAHGDRALVAARASAQALAEPLGSPREVVERLCCLQSQDLPAAKWALGARAGGCLEADVDRALDDGSVVRTWTMRGTLHLVCAEDVRWLLGLTAERMRRASARRREQLGLTARDTALAADASVAALSGGRSLDRAGLLAAWNRAGIDTTGQRGYHLISLLAIDGLLVQGPVDGRAQGFVLLDEWAPAQRELDGDEALAELVRRYLRGHAPATERDLAWWAGLPVGMVRRGIAAAGDTVEHLAEDRLDLAETPPTAPAGLPTLLLPAFDEYYLGYAERDAIAAPDTFTRIVPGGNGVFRPVIVASGRVAGTWRARRTRGRAVVELDAFRALSGRERAGLEASARLWGRFTGIDAELAPDGSADGE